MDSVKIEDGTDGKASTDDLIYCSLGHNKSYGQDRVVSFLKLLKAQA